MNIDDLTIKEAREIAALFEKVSNKSEEWTTPHIGKRCIVRTYASGVFCGTVIAQHERMIEIGNARRLWYWKTESGISLSAVATVGVDQKKCRFPQSVERMTVLDALEIIPATPKALASIDACPIAEEK